MGYAWQHFASFKSALTSLGLRPWELPKRPLIIDIGCGPATAMVAIGEWLLESRGRRTDVRYVGIERSEHFRRLASAFSTDPMLFDDYAPLLLPSIADFTPDHVAIQLAGRDGVVILMSYVLHQDFMATGDTVIEVIRRMSGSTVPIRILAQDANLPRLAEPNVEEWPETRLRSIVDRAELFGYRSRLWQRRIEAKKYAPDAAGRWVEQESAGEAKTCALAVVLERG